MAKIPNVIRPEIKIEYSGIIGFFAAISAIVRVGIREVWFELNGKRIAKSYIIPKYSLRSL